MKNILITGQPGVGKTTLLRKIIRELNLDAGGFYTQEVREEGIRQGFEIITLNGRRGMLAAVDFKSPYRVGKYGVNLKDLEEVAIPAMEETLGRKDFLVIDEIGKMELFSKKFIHVLRKALDSPTRVLGVMKLHDNPLTREVKSRPDTALYTLKRDNFDELAQELKNALVEVE